MAFTEGFFAAETALTVENMNACLLGWGPLADFPAAAAGNKGRMAWATDVKLMYYSSGSAWVVFAIPKYTEIASPPSAKGTNTTWVDWDLSATIPANAIAVLIVFDSTSVVGVRANGSAMTATFASAAKVSSMIVDLDAGRIIEIYTANSGLSTFYAFGYFS